MLIKHFIFEICSAYVLQNINILKAGHFSVFASDKFVIKSKIQ